MILEIFLTKFMAKHRTKEDRIRASLRRPVAVAKSITAPTLQKDYLTEIFAYDPKLIVKDLRKTLLVFAVILLILLTVALLYT